MATENLQLIFPHDLNGRHTTNSILDAYVLSEWTDLTATTIYKSGLTKSGHWYINKIDMTAGTSKFIFGTSDYATAWTNRASLEYELIHEA